MNYYIDENGRAVRCSDDSLMHYGVKGMKWGKRKAQEYRDYATGHRESARESKEIGQYKAQKLTAKGKVEKAKKVAAKWNKIANADYAKAREYEKKAAAKERGADFQKRQADVGRSRSTDAKIVTNILGGAFANRTYNSVIAAGGSKTGAAVVTALTSAGGPLAHIAVSSAYRRAAERGELEYQTRGGRK